MAARRPTPRPPQRSDRYAQLEHHLGTALGTRLRRAREEMGLSQEELGQALGYAATMISAFEKGRRRLKLEDLTRACIVLDKEPEYFLAPSPGVPVGPVGLTLRAELARLPNDDLAVSIEAFLDHLEGAQPAETVPDLGHLQPEAAARKVLALADIDEPPVQMEAVCQALQVPIHRRDFPEPLSALVLEVADGVFVIGVNAKHAPTRRRFSLAHELGHAVLRHEASYFVEYSVDDAWEPPDYDYLDEREANSFAADLLMDERWVRRDFAAGLRTASELAPRYEVSEAAMGFRLMNLGLV